MSKMVLKDGTEVKIEAGASLASIKVVSVSKEAMLAAWNAFTIDNLKLVQVQNDGGTVIGEYTDLVLVSETSIIQADGSIVTSFSLREKTETELLQEKVAALEADMEALNTTLGGE